MLEQKDQGQSNGLDGRTVNDSDDRTADSKTETEGNFIQRLTEAFQSKDAQSILDLLWEVDKALVSEMPDNMRRLSRRGWAEVLEEFLSDVKKRDYANGVYYLSDAGLSRLGVNWKGEGNIRIFPTYNSTKKVMQAWDRLK